MFVTWLISYDACGFSTYLYKNIFRNIIGLWEYVGYTVFITVWLYMISLCDPANNNADGKLCHLSCSTQGKYLITPFLIKAYHTTYILLLIKLVVKKLRAMHGMHLMMIRQLRISSDNGCLLACKICLATRVQLNDCSLCLKGETAVHLFMPPLAWLHTLFSCFGLCTTIAWLDIHSASNPSCMLHTQLKSNQTKIVSCWGRRLFFSLYLLTFSCKKDISLPLSLSFLWN